MMCFCCCEVDNQIHPDKLEKPEKFIQRIIISIVNYNSCVFQVIVYSVYSEQFIILTCNGFVFVKFTNELFNNIQFHAMIVYSISCITTKEMLYTNKYDLFGVMHHVELDYYLTQI